METRKTATAEEEDGPATRAAEGTAAAAAKPAARGRPRLVSLLELETGPKRALVVDGPGLFVGKHSERLRVTYQREVLQEAPLFDLEHVLIVGRGISLSSDVVAVCVEHGIALDFSPSGKSRRPR